MLRNGNGWQEESRLTDAGEMTIVIDLMCKTSPPNQTPQQNDEQQSKSDEACDI